MMASIVDRINDGNELFRDECVWIIFVCVKYVWTLHDDIFWTFQWMLEKFWNKYERFRIDQTRVKAHKFQVQNCAKEYCKSHVDF